MIRYQRTILNSLKAARASRRRGLGARGGDYVLAVNDSAAEDWGTESTVVAQGVTSTDAEFMAHARTDVLRLVAELRRLRQGQP